MTATNKERLLFLCTGNYYRSRFAEEYFNQLAAEHNLTWRAESRGLAEHLDQIAGNLGPVSVHALRYLSLYRIEPLGLRRYPQSVAAADFDRFDRIVALNRREHEPMLRARFPAIAPEVEYFDVEDVEVERPAVAMPRLVHHIDRLMARLGR